MAAGGEQVLGPAFLCRIRALSDLAELDADGRLTVIDRLGRRRIVGSIPATAIIGLLSAIMFAYKGGALRKMLSS